MSRVDDRDPRVSYSGAWAEMGVETEYMQTTKWTRAVGATATLPFTGTGISVHGAISKANTGYGVSPRATFVIDGRPTPWVGPQNDRIQRGIEFYRVEGLEYGDHTLVIVNDSSEGYLYLDFFDIAGTENPGAGASSASTGSSTSHGQDQTQTSSPSPPQVSSNHPDPAESLDRLDPTTERPDSPNATTEPNRGISYRPDPSTVEAHNPASSSSSRSTFRTLVGSSTNAPSPSSDEGFSRTSITDNKPGTPVGPIVGGVLGSIAAVCILFIILVICKRRRKNPYDGLGNHSPQLQVASPELRPPSYYVNEQPHGTASLAFGSFPTDSHAANPSQSNTGYQTGDYRPTVYGKSPISGYVYRGGPASGSDTGPSNARQTPSPQTLSSAASGDLGESPSISNHMSLEASGFSASTAQLSLVPPYSYRGDARESSNFGSPMSPKLQANMASEPPNRAMESSVTLSHPPGYRSEF